MTNSSDLKFSKMDTPIFQNKGGIVHLGEDGIIYVINKAAHMSLEEAIEGTNFIKKHLIKDGEKRPLFCDYTDLKSQSRECRDFFAGEENARIISACAILTGSSFGMVIANFFLGLNKPLMPTRLFTSKNKAVAWLKTFL